ncbi:hypothetical protein A3U60_22340, partial [Salmonella enterica subsp. enterica serovar Enteritidis]|nr:hypothetical protein [Salmonella enterica subsp. enterica serovar Enteritidis]
MMTVITVMVRPLIAAAYRARRDALSLLHQVAVPVVTVHVPPVLRYPVVREDARQSVRLPAFRPRFHPVSRSVR